MPGHPQSKSVILKLTRPTDEFSRQKALWPFAFTQHCPLESKSAFTRMAGVVMAFDEMPRVRFIQVIKLIEAVKY